MTGIGTVAAKAAHVRAAAQSREHHCHAKGCSVSVPPAMFMCERHWFMLPLAMRRVIWREYRPGQETDRAPSQLYLAAALAAVEHIAAADRKAAPQQTELPL